jgi:hypothetical protein
MPPQAQSLAAKPFVNAGICAGIFMLDGWNENRTMFRICSGLVEADMLKVFVEEAAALASLTLFVGMIAVWAQLFTQF